MKAHVMLSLGLLLAVIFAYRSVLAFAEPGLGAQEAYLAGGLVLSGWLIRGGFAEWRHAHQHAS